MACMGVPGAVANERRELMRADRGDVAVVETNGDRSVFFLPSPRRFCLRLIFHGSVDHGFGWFVGALDCDNSDCYRIIIHCEKARKEEWATNVAQYSKNTE